jgi:hypothetical protein
MIMIMVVWCKFHNGCVVLTNRRKENGQLSYLRDHDRVDEHLSRFKEGGKYYLYWVEDKGVDNQTMIDCTCTSMHDIISFVQLCFLRAAHDLATS